MSVDHSPARSHWGLWVHGVRPVGELVALARRAEEHGAAALLLADEGLDRDLYVTLTAIALATERVSLVPAITNPHSRHPAATAAALASLEEVAPGRVVAGLGVGGSLVFGPLGLRPSRPYTALAEAVEAVDALLGRERVTHRGEFTLDGAALPWSRGRLPIAIAGRGPRVEALAARRAEWVILSGKLVDDLPELVGDLRGQPDGGPSVYWNPAVAWTEDHVAELRSHFAYMTGDMPASWRERLGVGDDVVERLRSAVRDGGPAAGAALVPQEVVDAFAITGTREEVVARLTDVVARVRPEVVAFSPPEYTLEAVDRLADLALEVGLSRALAPVVRGLR